MSKIAFLLSRVRARSRRAWAGTSRRRFPPPVEVYRVGSEASGLDLEQLCFESPLEDLVETEVQQPALVATSLAILAALRERGHRAGRRRRPLGRRVRRAGRGRHRSGPARRSGSCASAAWRWPRRPGSARVDGRDPRARGRAGRDAVPQDPRRLAGELQLPGADRRLRRERGGRGVLRRGREPRRPTSHPAQGLRARSTARSSRGRPTG